MFDRELDPVLPVDVSGMQFGEIRDEIARRFRESDLYKDAMTDRILFGATIERLVDEVGLSSNSLELDEAVQELDYFSEYYHTMMEKRAGRGAA